MLKGRKLITGNPDRQSHRLDVAEYVNELLADKRVSNVKVEPHPRGNLITFDVEYGPQLHHESRNFDESPCDHLRD